MIITKISLNEDFLSQDRSKYPFNIKPLQSISKVPIKLRSNITFIIGENGTGKTTFMESLAVKSNAKRYGGSNNFIKDDSDKTILEDYLTLSRQSIPKDVFFFRAETFFNLQKDLEKYNNGSSNLTNQYTGSQKSFRELSHGQGFKTFFSNRIRPKGLYFFDEPESALSVDSQIELLFLLKGFVDQDCQIIISTHSPILLSYPDAQIISFDEDNGIIDVDYEDSKPFLDTKNFLENYKRFQKELS